MLKIIVTGGAGFIGSHTVIQLLQAGHKVWIIDNFSNSSQSVLQAIENLTDCEIECAVTDIRDKNKLIELFNSIQPDAVIHFAGLKSVSESISFPLEYYDVNVTGTNNILQAMQVVGCNKIVFSSSACVYSRNASTPFSESSETKPINPYGNTKLAAERLISDWVAADVKRQGVSLRYFNPVGAHQSGLIGEKPTSTPNNLMPYILDVASGKRDKLQVYGADYETKDGTGVRDYVHVVDLADAHIHALTAELKTGKNHIFNIGTGISYTVLEVIDTFVKINKVKVPYKFVEERLGDTPISVADTTLAHDILGWFAKLGLEEMCRDAWNNRSIAAADQI